MMGSSLGLERFGSSPDLIALTILMAWNFPYLIFCIYSDSIGPQIANKSKNVVAARNVSAVCLVTRSTRIALSALLNVFVANCSTKALPAMSSVIVSSVECSFLYCVGLSLE